MKIKYTPKRPINLTMTTNENVEVTISVSSMTASKVEAQSNAHKPMQCDGKVHSLPEFLSWMERHSVNNEESETI